MPRLDIWLVEEGYFSSRQSAKRAIKEGLVTVDGNPVKPSKQISGKEEVVVSNLASDLPQGYEKLKRIDEFLGSTLVSATTFALDIGSSAGGFLFYLREKGARAIGIEISTDFVDRLRSISDSSEGISLIVGDAFTVPLDDICNIGELDLLLIDVTTEPQSTLQLISRFTPLLKKGGKLVAAFKSRLDDSEITSVRDVVLGVGYENIQTIALNSARQEFHLIAIRH